MSKNTPDFNDPINLQVMWNRLIFIADQADNVLGRTAFSHKAIEVVDQRAVAVAAQIAQYCNLGEINSRPEVLPPPRRVVDCKKDDSGHQLSIAADCSLAARNGLLGRLMQRA